MARRNRTLTFQPDPDVAEVLDQLVRDNPGRGFLTDVINNALRDHLPEAMEGIWREELARLQQRLDRAEARRAARARKS